MKKLNPAQKEALKVLVNAYCLAKKRVGEFALFPESLGSGNMVEAQSRLEGITLLFEMFLHTKEISRLEEAIKFVSQDTIGVVPYYPVT